MAVRIITIDGPASSGKGTVAKMIARKLGFNYLESGAIYRALAFMLYSTGVSRSDEGQICAKVKSMNLLFAFNGDVMLNGVDVTKHLRVEEIGLIASQIAQLPKVRKELLQFQRDFAVLPGLVTDGRDMGSVVFPDATLKVYLTADAATRANRRLTQLHEQGKSATIGAVLSDIVKRDQMDEEREHAPLQHDESFLFLDNSSLSIRETVTKIIDAFTAKLEL